MLLVWMQQRRIQLVASPIIATESQRLLDSSVQKPLVDVQRAVTAGPRQKHQIDFATSNSKIGQKLMRKVIGCRG